MTLRHSIEEKRELLAQASALHEEGMPQTAIVGRLGISVMTLHRWRREVADAPIDFASQSRNLEKSKLIEENAQLKTLIVNMLLELQKLKERRA
jgi:uncharacterized protein YjcR